MRGNIQELPQSPPVSPTLMKAALNRAAGAAIRMSAANAKEKPAPAAAPLTAAITGLAQSAERGDRLRPRLLSPHNCAAVMSGSVLASARSKPAQNAAAGAGKYQHPGRLRRRRSSLAQLEQFA